MESIWATQIGPDFFCYYYDDDDTMLGGYGVGSESGINCGGQISSKYIV